MQAFKSKNDVEYSSNNICSYIMKFIMPYRTWHNINMLADNSATTFFLDIENNRNAKQGAILKSKITAGFIFPA